VLERAISAGNLVADPADWTELAASIDQRLTQGAGFPALAAALDRAAADGYDVASPLPALAAQGELSDRHPALDLHYRLLGDCDAALLLGDADTTSGPAGGSGTSAGRAPDRGPSNTPDPGAPQR